MAVGLSVGISADFVEDGSHKGLLIGFDESKFKPDDVIGRS